MEDLVDNYEIPLEAGPENKQETNERKGRKERTRLKGRANPDYREKERLRNLERTRRLRMNPEFRDKERIRNRVSKQRARLDPSYREAERIRNRLQKRKAREDPAYREAERVRNMWQKRRARANPDYRMRERLNDVERKRDKKWGRNKGEEEWMEIGAIEVDAEARVAFEQGLYRVVPGEGWNYWDHRDQSELPYQSFHPEWGGPLRIKSEPSQSLEWGENHNPYNYSAPIPPWDSANIFSFNKDSQIPPGGTNEVPHKSQQTISAKEPEDWSQMNNRTSHERVTKESNESWDNTSDETYNSENSTKSSSHSYTKPTVFPPDVCIPVLAQDAANQKAKSFKLDSTKNLISTSETALEQKLRVNFNDIEILPMNRRSESSCPNLNWQIEVLRVKTSKKENQSRVKDFEPLCSSPKQSTSGFKKYSKSFPPIQV